MLCYSIAWLQRCHSTALPGYSTAWLQHAWLQPCLAAALVTALPSYNSAWLQHKLATAILPGYNTGYSTPFLRNRLAICTSRYHCLSTALSANALPSSLHWLSNEHWGFLYARYTIDTFWLLSTVCLVICHFSASVYWLHQLLY